MLRSESGTSTWDYSQKHTSVLKCIFIKYNLRLAQLCPEKAAIQIEILWIFVFPPSCQIFHALCLPISYTEQYFKENTRCPWVLSLRSKETASTSLSSFFALQFFSGLSIYPLLSNDPLTLAPSVIWHFCWSHSLHVLLFVRLGNAQSHGNTYSYSTGITSNQSCRWHVDSWSQKSLPLFWTVQMNQGSWSSTSTANNEIHIHRINKRVEMATNAKTCIFDLCIRTKY